MSVINAMLKKLDQRGAPRPDFGPARVAPALNRSSPARWRLPLIVTLGGAAIGVTAFADWPQAIASNRSSGAIASPLAIADAAPVAVAASAPALAASVATDAATSTPSSATLTAAPRSADVERIAPGRAALPATASVASLPLPMPLPARIDKRSTAPTGAPALHRQATEQAQAGHSRAGLVLAREALAADPAYAPARLLAAVLEYETGATQRAIELLHDGLALQPQDKSQALLLARLQAQQGQTAAALATIDAHRLADATAQGLRAGLLAQSGDYARALAAYESAARQEPANPLWWFGLGVALESEGDPARARLAYSRAQASGLAPGELAQYAEQRLRALD